MLAPGAGNREARHLAQATAEIDSLLSRVVPNHAKRNPEDNLTDWFGSYLNHLQPTDDQPAQHPRDGPPPQAA